MTSPLSIQSSNHNLKPAFPRAGQLPGGCANLIPSMLSVKGCCAGPEAAALQPSPVPSAYPALLFPSPLHTHLVSGEDPRQLLPDQKHSHVWDEGCKSGQYLGRL